MQRLDKQIEFIKEIEKLKTITRQNLTLDNQRHENSAEHSWHIAIMAMLLSEHSQSPELDQLRVIKMLLIHDLVEIYAGDAFLYDEHARKLAKENEPIALEKLVSILPEDQAEEFITLWNEFEEGKTPEAQFATSLDALQPLLNHSITAPDNHNPHNLSKKEITAKKAFINDNTPKLWAVAEDAINKCVDKGLWLDK